MRPGSIGCRSSACAAGNRPARSRMVASALRASGGTWSTTNTAAEKSAGRPATTRVSASTPPADAPITTISWPRVFLFTHLLGHGQPDHERGALSLGGVHLDGSVVCRNDGLHQIQTYAKPTIRALVGLVEALEHLLPMFRRNPTPVVDHLQDGKVVFAPKADVDSPRAGPVLHGVGDQV